MAKLYVFGIGGTGARVLRSFTMMMAAGVKLGADTVVPIVIDPDAANADLNRTVALMNNYRDVRSHLAFVPDDETLFSARSCAKCFQTTLCTYGIRRTSCSANLLTFRPWTS